MLDTIVTAIVSVMGGSAATVLIQGFFNKKKTNAEAAAVTTETILKWGTSLTTRIENLEKSSAEKDQRINELIAKVAHLEAELEECRKNHAA